MTIRKEIMDDFDRLKAPLHYLETNGDCDCEICTELINSTPLVHPELNTVKDLTREELEHLTEKLYFLGKDIVKEREGLN